jgi:hypothetical protein
VIGISMAFIGNGLYHFGPSFFFWIGMMRFFADSQTLSPIFHGVYFVL